MTAFIILSCIVMALLCLGFIVYDLVSTLVAKRKAVERAMNRWIKEL